MASDFALATTNPYSTDRSGMALASFAAPAPAAKASGTAADEILQALQGQPLSQDARLDLLDGAARHLSSDELVTLNDQLPPQDLVTRDQLALAVSRQASPQTQADFFGALAQSRPEAPPAPAGKSAGEPAADRPAPAPSPSRPAVRPAAPQAEAGRIGTSPSAPSADLIALMNPTGATDLDTDIMISSLLDDDMPADASAA